MKLKPGSERIITGEGCDPVHGTVRWAPVKSFWLGSMTLAALIFGAPLFTWSAFALFIATCGITLCAGHSVGMHRRLIHQSFECPLWVERACVYLGMLVGMAGPYGMVRLHDFRDWAQRQSECHPYSRHAAGFWRDAWWQLHCKLVLARPPQFRLEPKLANDRFYQFVERTWIAQQLPWALIFFAVGGWPWVIWGICMRVSVCVTGHWLIGHFAHRRGSQSFIVLGAAAQGYNVPFAGFISMGESWHNNHHAFPASAKLGIFPGQIDVGWRFIKALEAFGLAWNVKTPVDLPPRPELRALVHGETSPTRLVTAQGAGR